MIEAGKPGLFGKVIEIDGRTVVLQVPNDQGFDDQSQAIVVNWDRVAYFTVDHGLKAYLESQ